MFPDGCKNLGTQLAHLKRASLKRGGATGSLELKMVVVWVLPDDEPLPAKLPTWMAGSRKDIVRAMTEEDDPIDFRRKRNVRCVLEVGLPPLEGLAGASMQVATKTQTASVSFDMSPILLGPATISKSILRAAPQSVEVEYHFDLVLFDPVLDALSERLGRGVGIELRPPAQQEMLASDATH